MAVSGVFGRSTGSWRPTAGVKLPCDARGEWGEPGRVDGAVMLRDDECARMASAASEPAGREAQQPWTHGQYGCLELVWCRG